MGALVGLLLGLGLLLVSWAVAAPNGARGARAVTGAARPPRRLLDETGMARVSPAALLGWCLASGLGAFVALAGVSRSLTIALAFGAIGTYAPLAVVRGRRTRRIMSLGNQWPDVVDDLTSAVRAGLALPEALVQIGTRGPIELRPAFASFTTHYRATGRFGDGLDQLITKAVSVLVIGNQPSPSGIAPAGQDASRFPA